MKAALLTAIAISVFSLLAVTATAQLAYHPPSQQELTGQVVAHDTPLANALIMVAGTSEGTFSLEDGTFQMHVNEWDHLVVHMFGYYPTLVTVADLTLSEAGNLIIEMEEIPAHLVPLLESAS